MKWIVEIGQKYAGYRNGVCGVCITNVATVNGIEVDTAQKAADKALVIVREQGIADAVIMTVECTYPLLIEEKEKPEEPEFTDSTEKEEKGQVEKEEVRDE